MYTQHANSLHSVTSNNVFLSLFLLKVDSQYDAGTASVMNITGEIFLTSHILFLMSNF